VDHLLIRYLLSSLLSSLLLGFQAKIGVYCIHLGYSAWAIIYVLKY